MRKSSENKMLSNSASKLKMEWMMMSKEEKKSYIIEICIIGYFVANMTYIVTGHTDPDYTIQMAAEAIGVILNAVLLYIMMGWCDRWREGIHHADRKKKGLRPEWTDQDFDLLDEDIEELYERVKALESRRY